MSEASTSIDKPIVKDECRRNKQSKPNTLPDNEEM